jgi:Rps23 Pro-64 3,4-dihydroxylase Tpa1-like proline 4-hydroxylase
MLKGINKMNKDKLKEKLDKDGYVIIDNFLPIDTINEINTIMLQSSYIKEEQIREGKYKMYKDVHFENKLAWNDSDLIPNDNEDFILNVGMSKDASQNSLIVSVVRGIIKEYVQFLSGEDISKCKISVMKSTKGDSMRCHLDDYNADIGFILYCSKEWKFDWGGLLHMLTGKDEVSTVVPKFNRIVFVLHKKAIPHSVSVIEEYAELDRLSLVGFCLPKNIDSPLWDSESSYTFSNIIEFD